MVFSLHTDKMFYDITEQVQKLVTIKNGFVIIQSMHTTAGIKIMENEKYLLGDIERYLEKLVPRSENYAHDDIERRELPNTERKNTISHLKSFFANTTEIIPVINNHLQLGQWQRIMFVEFDPGRDRTINIYETSNS